ncbi:hypothetical protein ACFDR9_001789 [Janthinobacterium sp. CG_23.3]|uniref:hypothetical protein n=1 Tax=Janthinobacterium sp. CG_23.3 TaxID=3349634 RepID=UPI0038D42183
MAYRWKTTDSVWLEDEHSGQFSLASSAGLGRIDWHTLARNRIPDVAQLLGASLPKGCQHGPIYPEGFAYCPSCGAALDNDSAKAAAPLPPWWDASSAATPDRLHSLPKHVPHGLPITALPLARALESRPPEPRVGQVERKIPKPPNLPCVFAAAHYGFARQRLLALAYSRDVLQYWDPRAATWQVLSGEPGAADLQFTASDYAWLPASGGRRGDVALVPSKQGLFRLLINPVSESYHTEAVFEAPLASAPGAVLRHIACLYVDGAGVGLWSALADGAEPLAWPCPAGVPAQGWSRPLSYDDKLMWLHEQGQLSWQAGAAPQWLAWPRDWTPRLNFGGATQSHDGRLWLIGKDTHGYSFVELGRENGQMERLEGARLGFGKLLFHRGHQVKRDPWDSADVDDARHDNTLVLPLLENFIPGREAASGLVLRLEPFAGVVETAFDAAATVPKTYVEWIGSRNVILDMLPNVASPADCVAFVYDDHLWLHHPKWPEMRGWHLKAVS